MTKLPIIIDSVDFTQYGDKYGYTVSYEEREGKNSGKALDGSLIVDIVARKAIVTWTCNPMSSTSLSQILSAISRDFVSLTYFDTKTNANRTATFRPVASSVQIALQTAAGVNWFKTLQVVFTEK